MIVEIKPYHIIHGDDPDAILTVMELTRDQLQEQVYFAFDTYTMLDDIYVLCVVGWHWDMLKFERGGNKLSVGKYVGGLQSKGKQKKAIDDHGFVSHHLLNEQLNDFSDDFKAEWDKVMGYVGLATNFA